MRRRLAWLAAVLVAAAALGLLLAGRGLEAGGSSLSRGASGWLAARLYLEGRGTPTRLLTAPLAPPEERTAAGPGVLVLVFPWQSRPFDLDPQVVLEHLAAGGDLVLGYSGDLAPTPAESQLLPLLAVEPEVLPLPRLAPLSWWREMARPLRLTPARRWAEGPQGLELRRQHWVAEPPPGSELLLAAGRPVAAAWRHGRGRVVLLPSELLCNARLGSAAHGSLLETLRQWLPGTWSFDEYHHGLGAPAAPATAARLGFDLLLAQLLLLYLVAALALGRRLGPPWRERPPLLGSAAGFLLRLGALHHRLGHHRAGAELLLRRSGELDRRFVPGPELSALAERGDAAALIELGQRLAGGGKARA